MSTTLNRELVLKEGNEAVRRTLQAVIRYRRLTGRDIAARTEVPYNTVQRYTGGHGQLTGGYLEVFARALSVPRFVLAMDEDEALSWVLEHAPNGSLVAGDTHRFPRAITSDSAYAQQPIPWPVDEPAVAVVDFCPELPQTEPEPAQSQADLAA